MSDEILRQILSKLESMETKQDDLDQRMADMDKRINTRLDRIESRLTATQEQVVKNSEAITIMINGQSRNEHQFQAFNKRLHTVETEIERLNKELIK